MSAAAKQRQQEDEKLLEEYLKMKPSRAIDRLLSQYSVQRGFQLYNLLQEKIKKNTSQLRSTLTSKYENLVDCSNLLSTIKKFTDEIEDIEQNLSIAFRSDHLQQSANKQSNRQSIINKSEELLFRKRYIDALKTTYQKCETLDQTQILYLPIMRIQVLSSLEEEIMQKKFTKSFIAEIIECIRLYIQQLTCKQRSELINNQRTNGQLLSLIAEALQSKIENTQFTQNQVIEIIFRCKLLSVNRLTFKHNKQQAGIHKFFFDILQLISQKQTNNTQISHLSAIFCRNLPQIEAHLLETFIVKQKDRTISFKFQLYQKLATSQQFINILENLHNVIISSFQQAPQRTLKESFLNLWQSYYNQLITLLFERINPIQFLPPLASDKLEHPKQINKYICSDDLSLESRIGNYNSQLQTFFSTLNKLLKESNQLKSSRLNTSQMLESITNLYLNKVQWLNKEINKFVENISSQPNLNKLGSIIYLFVFCDEFNNKFQNHSISEQFVYIKQLGRRQLTWDYKLLKDYSQCFYDRSRKQSKWSINFDHFFMKYYHPLLKQTKRNIIKQIILALLEGTMETIDSQKASLFLRQKKIIQQRQRLQLQEKRSRLPDIPTEEIKPTTFAKKKKQIEQNV